MRITKTLINSVKFVLTSVRAAADAQATGQGWAVVPGGASLVIRMLRGQLEECGKRLEVLGELQGRINSLAHEVGELQGELVRERKDPAQARQIRQLKENLDRASDRILSMVRDQKEILEQHAVEKRQLQESSEEEAAKASRLSLKALGLRDRLEMEQASHKDTKGELGRVAATLAKARNDWTEEAMDLKNEIADLVYEGELERGGG